MDEDQAVHVRVAVSPTEWLVYLRLTLQAENEINRLSHSHWPRGG
jgi:hypothetical protein